MSTRNIAAWILAALVAWPLVAAAAKPPAALCQLRVETEPADAIVSLDGALRGAAPATIGDLPPGDHIVAVAKDGFREERKTITLSPGQPATLKLTLEPVFGLVLIQSTPASADVQIDGADRGKTPLFVSDVPAGKHRVKFIRAGSQSKELELVIKDRTPILLNADLTSDSASLTVDSTPQGAAVTVNGLSKGTTPCTVEAAVAGLSTVEITLAGYTPWSQSIKLSAGQKERLKADLKALPMELKIVSEPPEAKIYVQNQFKGEAPLTLTDVAPGPVTIRAELKGYAMMRRDVTLRAGEKTTELFRLSKDSGLLELTTEPSGVLVKIDDQPAGTTKPKGEEVEMLSEVLSVDFITEGSHQVELSRKGYFTTNFTVTISKDKPLARHDVLKRDFVPNYEVKTTTRTLRGMLVEVLANGDVKIEVRPGVVETIPFKEVRLRRPLEPPRPPAPRP